MEVVSLLVVLVLVSAFIELLSGLPVVLFIVLSGSDIIVESVSSVVVSCDWQEAIATHNARTAKMDLDFMMVVLISLKLGCIRITLCQYGGDLGKMV